jgi:uncharacterized protein YjiS (DUF1127 family)
MMSEARRIEAGGHECQATSLAETLYGAGAWLALALLRWRELARQRRRLLSLDDRMLKDIGITRAEAMREGTRPFWDTPGIDGTRWP